MTALNSNIVFNNSTGSDTAASGCGPATAVSGAGASSTAASAVVTGIDTTGVVSGDLLWIDSTSGRQFSAILTVDSGTQVTCDDVLANTESGRNWGIGGKRLNPFAGASNLKLLENAAGVGDAEDEWVIDIEETGTTYQILSKVLFISVGSTSSSFTIKSSSATKPLIDPNRTAGLGFSDVFDFTTSHVIFENLNIESQDTSEHGDLFQMGGNCSITVVDCVLSADIIASGSNARVFSTSNSSSCFFTAERTKFIGWDNANVISPSGGQKNSNWKFNLCYFVDCYSLNHASNQRGVLVVTNCVFDTCNTNFIAPNSADVSSDTWLENIFYNSTGSNGALYVIAFSRVNSLNIYGNIFVNNTGYGIKFSTARTGPVGIIDRNAFYNNLGEVDGVDSGPNDITLTADPFVDAANGDFNLNNLMGGGLVLRQATVTLP